MSDERAGVFGQFALASNELKTKIKQMSKTIGFLKTTGIGGVLFLLPLIVVGALLGQMVPIVLTIAKFFGKWIPVKTPGGVALLILLAIAAVLLMCFGAGLLARRSFGKRISQSFEKNLLLLFPRYAIFKDQMAGRIGGDETKPRMKPMLARFDDSLRIGFEMDRTDDGVVTVYLPGAPDPWSGSVVFLNADRVEPMDIEFADAVATFEKLGRDSAPLLTSKVSESSQHNSESRQIT